MTGDRGAARLARKNGSGHYKNWTLSTRAKNKSHSIYVALKKNIYKTLWFIQVLKEIFVHLTCNRSSVASMNRIFGKCFVGLLQFSEYFTVGKLALHELNRFIWNISHTVSGYSFQLRNMKEINFDCLKCVLEIFDLKYKFNWNIKFHIKWNLYICVVMLRTILFVID